MPSSALLSARVVRTVLAATLLCTSLAGIGVSPAIAQDAAGTGVQRVVGELSFTNPSFFLPEDKPFMLLADLTAYIERDPQLPLPLEAQIIGPVIGSSEAGAEFVVNLPLVPQGTAHSFGPLAGRDAGTQVYSLEYMFESDGQPYVDPGELVGWPAQLSSVAWSSDTQDATGGQLIVWAADDRQQFPTGFGDDGLLFTNDDPLATLEPGWTGVELDEDEFTWVRSAEFEMGIIEGDTWFYDLSDLGYVDAFTELIDTLEIRYPFTEEKGIDWDAIREEYLPLVEEAEDDNDPDAFAAVLYEIAMSFGDGHVGTMFPEAVFEEEFGGYLGLQFAETDDGELVVTQVWDGFGHDRSGIEVGAEVLGWNGLDPAEAIDEQVRIFPASSPHAQRYWQVDSLSWGELGDRVEIEFRNPGGRRQEATVRYDYFPDEGSYLQQVQYGVALGDPSVLPVSAEILPSGIGYIRVASFYDDPLLTIAAWELALRTFEEVGIDRIVVDTRGNGGGWVSTALALAAFVPYDEDVIFENTMIDIATGAELDLTFGIPAGEPEYEVDVAVLIDATCMSACELFAAAVGQSPNAVIIGSTPTGGGVSTVSEWALPDELFFTASSTRTALAGEPLLEGAGVAPDIDVPITVESLQDDIDDLLAAAEDELGA